jgi:hypothetical protein
MNGTSRASISAKVTTSTALAGLVDVEIYSPSGVKVFQKSYDGRTFAANKTQTFSTSWSIARSAEKGTYTVKVGLFKPGWSGLLAWNDSAASFTVR